MTQREAVDQLYFIKCVDKEAAESILFLNQLQFSLFNISPGARLNLTVGFTSVEVVVREQRLDTSPSTIYISKLAYTQLCFYQGEALCLSCFTKDKIVFGVTLAVTIPLRNWKKINKYPVLRKRAQLAREKGLILYYICPDFLELNKDLVESYYLDKITEKWTKQLFPYPQIIYTRSPFPRHLFPNACWINEAAPFEKWSNYQVLSSHKETAQLQPETALLTLSSLNNFLIKYKLSFVKNIFGRCGRQVVRIEKKDKRLLCKAGGTNIKQWSFAKPEHLLNFLFKHLGNDLIIQRGIDLAKIHNHPFDMRVLAQKDIRGQWLISAVSFRIAKPKAIVTNIAAGATELALAPGDPLPCAKLAWDKLQEFCLVILTALESSLGVLGEVGLDIAIDRQGRLWFIEANSQPSSRGYLEAAAPEVCNRIFGLPLDYAKFLAMKMHYRKE